jgi:hypothetical protein
MKKQHYPLLISFSLLALSAACTIQPPESYFNRGGPESLMDMSSEVVTFDVNADTGITDMTNWINQDQPSRAELSCDQASASCNQAQQALNQFGVPVSFASSGQNVVTLYYDRVVARDCENRFIDNSVNPYNLTHPTLGCSLASNMVQQITDKRQITSPTLLDYQDGERIERAMDGYRQPYDTTPMKIDPNLQRLSTTQTTQ